MILPGRHGPLSVGYASRTEQAASCTSSVPVSPSMIPRKRLLRLPPRATSVACNSSRSRRRTSTGLPRTTRAVHPARPPMIVSAVPRASPASFASNSAKCPAWNPVWIAGAVSRAVTAWRTRFSLGQARAPAGGPRSPSRSHPHRQRCARTSSCRHPIGASAEASEPRSPELRPAALSRRPRCRTWTARAETAIRSRSCDRRRDSIDAARERRVPAADRAAVADGRACELERGRVGICRACETSSQSRMYSPSAASQRAAAGKSVEPAKPSGAGCA